LILVQNQTVEPQIVLLHTRKRAARKRLTFTWCLPNSSLFAKPIFEVLFWGFEGQAKENHWGKYFINHQRSEKNTTNDYIITSIESLPDLSLSQVIY